MEKFGTVLCVDDNPAILTALKFLLGNHFENVHTLPHPEKASQLIAQEQVDLVILDMNFTIGVNNGHEGIYWLQQIRQHHPDTPVILLTAYGGIDIAVKGLKNGAADFITKPWDNMELIRKIREILQTKSEVQTLDEVEADHIRVALDRTRGNLSKTADMLGITRQTLYNKMKKLGV